MSLESDLWKMLLAWEKEVEEMRAAGLLPLRLSPAEREAARQRTRSDYLEIERLADKHAAAATVAGDFQAVAQLLDVAGQARLNREKLG